MKTEAEMDICFERSRKENLLRYFVDEKQMHDTRVQFRKDHDLPERIEDMTVHIPTSGFMDMLEFAIIGLRCELTNEVNKGEEE